MYYTIFNFNKFVCLFFVWLLRCVSHETNRSNRTRTGPIGCDKINATVMIANHQN